MFEISEDLLREHRAKELRFFVNKYEKAHPYPLGEGWQSAVEHSRNLSLSIHAYMQE